MRLIQGEQNNPPQGHPSSALTKPSQGEFDNCITESLLWKPAFWLLPQRTRCSFTLEIPDVKALAGTGSCRTCRGHMGALGLHGGPLPLGWITKLEGCAGLRMCQNTSKPREGVAHGCSSRRNGVLQGDRDGLDCRSRHSRVGFALPGASGWLTMV